MSGDGEKKQLLHLVFGGELKSLKGVEFWDLESIDIVGVFDSSSDKVGMDLGRLSVQAFEQLAETVRNQKIKLAIVAVPASHAQSVVDLLVESGVRGILNYAPIVVQVPDGVWVRHIDPVALLHSMTYYLAHEEQRSLDIID